MKRLVPLCLAVVLSPEAHACIDPGTGSVILREDGAHSGDLRKIKDRAAGRAANDTVRALGVERPSRFTGCNLLELGSERRIDTVHRYDEMDDCNHFVISREAVQQVGKRSPC